ncbi:MAG: bifunctional phosphoglucose/phosphomannose isomerase [Candidatus Nomurabacteria bacterium]|nr:bifunctional phosphoglucose/phosphomannose isomerase [Candidatus Nomurabacteria bacterium]
MEKLIENFGLQLQDAIRIGERIEFTQELRRFSNVVIAGMGGSGIGGTIVSELVLGESEVPIYISKNYFLPKFVNKETLVIISSYSGNTEETVNALNEAVEKGAKVVCIASGGKVIEIAKEKKLNHVQIPNTVIAEGVSSPRAAIGYSIVQIFFILNFFNVISDKWQNEMAKAIALIESERENIKKEAQIIAEKILGKFPVVYAPAGSEGVAVRFKQQLNENAKMLAWYNVIPEMNHNELLGWEGGTDNLVVIIFRNDNDYSHIAQRIEFSKEVILKHTKDIVEIYSKGESAIERAIYHIHVGDYVSIYLANLRHVNPNDLAEIEALKSFLASK